MSEMKIPKYRKHSVRDRAFVEWQGKRCLLDGPYNSDKSKAHYRRFITDNFGVTPAIMPTAKAGCTVSELCRDFLVQLREQSTDNLRGVYGNYKAALKPFCVEYGAEQAASVGPLMLKRWQKKLAERKLSRAYINSCVVNIQQTFRWAASEELIPSSVWHGLQSVTGLRRGKSAAKESVKRKPVPWSYIADLLPYLSKNIRAMLLLQWYTGARSQSICMATPSQFERDGEFLIWKPRHKTENWGEGKVLTVPLGPRAQEVVAPFLNGDPSKPMFSPRAIKKHPRFRDRYSSGSYRECIIDVINRVNEQRLPLYHPAMPLWSPHQLRHSKGHMVRQNYGLEAAQATLGHDSMSATEIYSERRLDLAKLVARETG